MTWLAVADHAKKELMEHAISGHNQMDNASRVRSPLDRVSLATSQARGVITEIWPGRYDSFSARLV